MVASYSLVVAVGERLLLVLRIGHRTDAGLDIDIRLVVAVEHQNSSVVADVGVVIRAASWPMAG